MSVKGKRKPMTVEAILDGPVLAASSSQTGAPESGPSEGRRSHVKQLTLYLPHPVYRQLREMAFHEEKRMHSLLIEGLDLLLADRGVPSVEQLIRSSSS